MNCAFKMDLYCGNFSNLLGLLVLLYVAAPARLEKTTLTAVEGGEVSFECQTESEGCSNSEWHYSNKNDFGFVPIHRGGNVLNNSHGRYSIAANSSSGKCVLIVTNVSMTDSGTYICGLNGDLLDAELIVFDKYPSEQFCSISVLSNEPRIGSNACCLPPDTVEASCEMRFRDDSNNLHPQLEWSVDGRIIPADESAVDNSTTVVSRVRVSATELQSSSRLVCRVKYRNNNNIQANLTWSKHIGLDVTILRDTSDLTEVPCAQTIVNCSDTDDATRLYSWVNESNIKMSENRQLDLNGKPMGIYSCVVTHFVRDKWCSYVVKRINFTCNETQSIEPSAQPVLGLGTRSHNSTVIVVVLLCVVGVVSVGIVIYFVWMRNRRARNLLPRANNYEGTNEHLAADANIYEQQSLTEVASASKE